MANVCASRTKRIVQSDNDLSEAEQPFKKQLKRTSKPSAKITETDKENLKKANAQIAKLKKQMLKLQSQQGDDD
ncbi:hypothetical protein C0991_001161, partial [Blastosporella zonata]